ncbi:aldehyde dehydrogenase family protein [Sphingobium phenoxybenzoativorans]|uniref:Aldehyde dehydrogenase family protein n=1 Tax=Sphingobium phenoxybenzoativorans TaxID=1592790 RepID=A0A975K8N7_9SPHN|nr:aldehyde dehydrogenase family protein [Sphingobium phenoxybenzoativorans]QUT06855.1 aldehyde dehydrogenase family protein [Sphingobium phenoxybenzoativorans]
MIEVHKNLIDGCWSDTTASFETINPSDTDDVVAHCAAATVEDVRQAAAAAKHAAASWARSPIQLRQEILRATSDELLVRKAELGRLLSREEGKPLAEGVAEVVRAAQIFDFFAGECLRLQGEMMASTRPSVSVEITREPVGVVGIITPWNIPLAIPAWKIAPALAYGNSVVFKPAEIVSATAWVLVDVLKRAGLPGGVLNLVMGSGATVGQTIVESDDIDAVSFTGSTRTGRTIAAGCVARMKKVQLEMGGKNPLVVLADCHLETAVECAVNGAFFATGQRCTASERLIVEDAIHDKFVAAVSERMGSLVVGHALADGTEIGPVASQAQLEQNLSYMDIGKQEGAVLLCGGDPLDRGTPGFYMAPALFVEATNQMRTSREEIFGPVASVIRVKDYDEALALANDTEFGLSSGICTTSIKQATHFKRNSQAGVVAVNLPTAGADFHVPFGGTKRSSYGPREQGRYAIEFYTTVKTAYTHAG